MILTYVMFCNLPQLFHYPFETLGMKGRSRINGSGIRHQPRLVAGGFLGSDADLVERFYDAPITRASMRSDFPRSYMCRIASSVI